MARDYRYGASPKKGFQRRSQQKSMEEVPVAEGGANQVFWLLGISLGFIFIATYLIVSHFLSGQSKASQVSKVKPMPSVQQVSVEEKKTLSAKKEGQVAQRTEMEIIDKKAEALRHKTEREKVEEVAKESSKPLHYTFYRGLAKTEVIVEATPLPVKLAQPYYIQAGSFGRLEVAQKEQARLAKLGFQTEISALKGEKRVYYRLRLGPFRDRLVMNKVRNELRSRGVDTLLIKAIEPKKESKENIQPLSE